MRRAVQGRVHEGRRGRRRGAVALLALAALAAVLAGCGETGDGSGTTGAGAAGTAPTAMQVLTRAERGDIIATVTGRATVTAAKGKTTVVATLPSADAASVAVGQKASVMLFPAGVNAGAGGPVPQGAPSGAPVPDGVPSGMPQPQPGQSGAPGRQGGTNPGAFPGGREGFGRVDFRGRGTDGTVAAVSPNDDGSAAVTIKLKTVPSNATDGAVGMAAIETQVLAADVVVIPTAAISGSGDAATVQVLAGGQTTSRQVQIGQQADGQSEIVSGLEVGENVVWTRSFPGGARAGSSFPARGQSNGSANGGATQ